MKILLLAFFCLALVGCGAAYQYNAKMDRLNNYHKQISTADLSEQEKDLLYLAEVEKEFPAYFEEIHYLKKKVRAIYVKMENDEKVDEYKEDFNIAVKKFWQIVQSDVRQQDTATIRALSEINAENARRNQQTYDNLQQNNVHCSTQYIGSSAFTNCY